MYPAPFCYDATTLVKITSSSFQTVWMQGGLCWGSPSLLVLRYGAVEGMVEVHETSSHAICCIAGCVHYCPSKGALLDDAIFILSTFPKEQY